MSTASRTNKSLFINTLLVNQMAYGRKLIEQAEYAVSVRAFETVAQIGTQLCELSGAYSKAGDLYLALALNRLPDNRVQAEQLLLLQGGARAWLALGSNSLIRGDVSTALGFYSKAARDSSPLTGFCAAMMGVAVLSLERRHSEALDALNGISRLARYVGRVYPAYELDFHNSVAVELNATGHTDEARAVIAPVAASPLARVYPEWRETQSEIGQPRPTLVNVLEFKIDRPSQVRRIEAVLYDEQIDGRRLRDYASAGETAIAR